MSTEQVAIITIEMPQSCIEWLDYESIRWKHKTGAKRASKSAVITELVKKAMGEQIEE